MRLGAIGTAASGALVGSDGPGVSDIAAQGLDVAQVLQAAGGALVLDERLPPDDIRFHAPEGGTHATGPGLCEGQTRQRRTTRNRTSCAQNARNRSTKSWFIGELAAEPPLLFAEPPYLQHSLVDRECAPVGGVGSIVLRKRREGRDLHASGAVAVGHTIIVARFQRSPAHGARCGP